MTRDSTAKKKNASTHPQTCTAARHPPSLSASCAHFTLDTAHSSSPVGKSPSCRENGKRERVMRPGMSKWGEVTVLVSGGASPNAALVCGCGPGVCQLRLSNFLVGTLTSSSTASTFLEGSLAAGGLRTPPIGGGQPKHTHRQRARKRLKWDGDRLVACALWQVPHVERRMSSPLGAVQGEEARASRQRTS